MKVKNLNQTLMEENRKLKEERDFFYKSAKQFREENEKLKKYYDREKEELAESCYDLAKENQKLKETIKDHQLYEDKLEHRIIEFEELLH